MFCKYFSEIDENNASKDFFRIKVADTGIGISSRMQPLIFKLSGVQDNTREDLSLASGFSLYLAQRMAKELGSEITFESKARDALDDKKLESGDYKRQNIGSTF